MVFYGFNLASIQVFVRNSLRMGRLVSLSCCSLNQWAMDFTGNYERIIRSIKLARESGSRLRVGSELEICGYSCQDHLLESDLYFHCWQVLGRIVGDEDCKDILIDIGMPVMHKNTSYNCVVIIFNGKILLIRPKMALCDDRNYRESRWFRSWKKERQIEQHALPQIIQKITGQASVPFGDAVISTRDTCIGFETCEELWTARSSMVELSLDGVEIICNSSASHHELNKSAYQLNQLILAGTTKLGGIYVFSNQRGGDGDRLYFDGNSTIAQNDQLFARGAQFSPVNVEVKTAVLDIEDVRTYRNQIRSSRESATFSQSFPRIHVDFSLCPEGSIVDVTRPIKFVGPTTEQEIAYGPACWMWDYLTRSKQSGFFLPLSGGKDSAAVASMVYIMCKIVTDTIINTEDDYVHDSLSNEVTRLMGEKGQVTPKELCNRILFTCYMASDNSSEETRTCAAQLAMSINSSHSELKIDSTTSAVCNEFQRVHAMTPSFESGDSRENLALQNIQARLRMVFAYFNAQLILPSLKRPGNLLVLGTSNVDEGLRGYLTKYDCSSADINPIGSISKVDLSRFLQYAMTIYEIEGLAGIIDSVASAELIPLEEGKMVQSDEGPPGFEPLDALSLSYFCLTVICMNILIYNAVSFSVEMGMTYEELSQFGRLRKPGACGPFSMFQKLHREWSHEKTPKEIADKVKHFFRCYGMNRHKATVMTPAYHAESYSPDDNRHDHRPFLYPDWSWQFNAIDKQVALLSSRQ